MSDQSLREQIIEECKRAIRAACGACDGKGGWENAGECEYCGRPMRALDALAAAPQPERNDMPLRDGGFANATFEGIGSVHSDRRTRSPMGRDKQERRGVTWTEDAAAPNNAGEPDLREKYEALLKRAGLVREGDSAIATSERPDRASSDSGITELVSALVDDLISRRGINPEWSQWEDIRSQWCSIVRDALKTASSANGNAVAGESPDARLLSKLTWAAVRLFEAKPEALISLPEWDALSTAIHEASSRVAAVDAAMGSPTDDPKKGDCNGTGHA